MLIGEFDKVIDELVCSFGSRSYPAQTVDRIWHTVKDLPVQKLKWAIDSILDEFVRPPSPAQIRRQLGPALANLRAANRKKMMDELSEKGKGCFWCNLTGWVEAYDLTDVNAGAYGFSCPYCPAAGILGIADSIPPWSDSIGDEFHPVRASSYVEDMKKVKDVRNKSGMIEENQRLAKESIREMGL